MGLTPDLFFNRITEITLSFLKANGIRGLILDIDNTLAYDGDFSLPEDVRMWIIGLINAGMPAIIVSNSKEKRTRTFADQCMLPYYAQALKPSRRSRAVVEDILNVQPQEIAIIGDQLFTDIWYGKRMGYKTILVEKMGEDRPLFVKMKRMLEKPVMNRIRKRGVDKA
jgi:HAD superfamily (subfamily IIIA) phosphatase, TIGR01668